MKDIDIVSHQRLKMLPENIKENIGIALAQSLQRSMLIDELNKQKGDESMLMMGKRNPCLNIVCPNCSDSECVVPNDLSHDCLYCMTSPPPNSINYNEYMPSHQEALDKLEELGELQGDKTEYALMNRNYGKARNQTERWASEVKGIDFNMIKSAIKTALTAHIAYLDRIGEINNISNDISVIASNSCVEIEKAMGIFPNIQL